MAVIARRRQCLAAAPGASLDLLVVLVGAFSLAAHADDKSDLTQEVVVGCIYGLGEFGEAAVQECIRSELAAAEALQAYPPDAKPIVDRCSKGFGARGYGMIEMCVKRDLAADIALRDYAAQHAAIIGGCEQSAGKRGRAAVKACVEGAIAKESAGPR